MDCSSSIDYCSRCRILLQLLFWPHESEWTIWKCILTCELEWLVLNYLYLYIYTVCPDSCTVCPSVHFECVESMHWPVRHVGSTCVLALHRITYIYARGDFLTFKKEKGKKKEACMVRFEPNRHSALCQLCRILSLMAATFNSISIPIKALLKFNSFFHDPRQRVSSLQHWQVGGWGAGPGN